MPKLNELTMDCNETTPSKSIVRGCTISLNQKVERNDFHYFLLGENQVKIGKVLEIIDENRISVRWYLKFSQLPRIPDYDLGRINLSPRELIEQAYTETPEIINKKSACGKVLVIYVSSKQLFDDVLRLEHKIKTESDPKEMYVCRYKLIKTTVYQLKPISFYDDGVDGGGGDNGAYSDIDQISVASSHIETMDLEHEIQKLCVSTIERIDKPAIINKKTGKQVTPLKIVNKSSVQKVKRSTDDFDADDEDAELSPSKRSKILINDTNQNYLPESPVNGSRTNHHSSKQKMTNVKKNLNQSFAESIPESMDEDDACIDSPKNQQQHYTSIATEPTKLVIRALKEKNENSSTHYDTPTKMLRNKQISQIENTTKTTTTTTNRRSILRSANDSTPKKNTPRKSVIINAPPQLNDDAQNDNIPSTPRRQSKRISSANAAAKNLAIAQDEKSPEIEKHRTPRSTRAKSVEHNKSMIEDEPATPRRTRRSTAAKTPLKTPSSSTMTPQQQRKLYRSGGLTPSIQGRELPMKSDQTELEMVRERLHVSAVPQSLPCREKEFDNIHAFLIGKLTDKCGGCIYVSGVPGTGKTATVTQVIRQIQSERKRKLPSFDYIEINGMRLTEPRQAYVQIYRQLTGKTLAWAQARDLLEERFTGANKKSTTTKTTILLVDELDIICNRKQDVVYNLFDWTTRKGSCLVAITIANTMDLPERVLKLKVASRLGLTRITFQPYSFKQLQEVVMARLAGSSCFVSDAVQLVARKVASISGDCRRALDICRRATEIAEESSSNQKDHIVNFAHVNQALSEMFASPKVRAIKNCTKSEKLFLQAVASEITRTGIEEVEFYGVYMQIASLAPLLGITNPLTEENAMRVCMTLAQNRLLITEDSSMGLYQKIILNVSVDDLYYALNN